MKLDVGCGNNPRGDVNTDLYVEDTFNHRAHNHDRLNVHAIPNLIICDALHLPFIDKSFEWVFCAQLIEHLPEPAALIRELHRVAKYRLTIETVHRMGEQFIRKKDWSREHHISHFNFNTLKAAAPKFGMRVTREYCLHYTHFPFEWLSLIQLPYEIGVDFAC